MIKFLPVTLNDASNYLANGKVGVIPTDTIYGLVGEALLPNTVERIYEIKVRKPDKPLIILISSLEDLKLFGIKINEKTKSIFKEYWPGKVSIILPCPKDKFEYLHRGTNTLAFRLPDYPDLRKLIKKTGPLVAPSANPAGLPPAKTIKEAQDYFGNRIDFYVDGGRLDSPPSTLISLASGKVEVLREGAVAVRNRHATRSFNAR